MQRSSASFDLDETVVWVAATGQFYYGSNGEPQRMLGIAVDITERGTLKIRYACSED